MLNQLICHKCLSVVFPPLPGMGRCQQRGVGGAEPSPPRGGCPCIPAWGVQGHLGIKLNFAAVPLAGGCWDRARGCPRGGAGAWDCFRASPLHPGLIRRSDLQGENGDFVVSSRARLGIGVWF